MMRMVKISGATVNQETTRYLLGQMTNGNNFQNTYVKMECKTKVFGRYLSRNTRENSCESRRELLRCETTSGQKKQKDSSTYPTHSKTQNQCQGGKEGIS